MQLHHLIWNVAGELTKPDLHVGELSKVPNWTTELVELKYWSTELVEPKYWSEIPNYSRFCTSEFVCEENVLVGVSSFSSMKPVAAASSTTKSNFSSVLQYFSLALNSVPQLETSVLIRCTLIRKILCSPHKDKIYTIASLCNISLILLYSISCEIPENTQWDIFHIFTSRR